MPQWDTKHAVSSPWPALRSYPLRRLSMKQQTIIAACLLWPRPCACWARPRSLTSSNSTLSTVPVSHRKLASRFASSPS